MLQESVINKILSNGESKGADFVEVYAEANLGKDFVFDNAQLDNVSTSKSQGAGIRVSVGSQMGFAHTGDLSERSLLAAVESALASAKALKSFSDRGKSVDINHKGFGPANSQLNGEFGQDSEKELAVTEDIIEKLREADEIARAMDGRVSNVSARCMTSAKTKQVVNNLGTNETSTLERTRFITQVSVSQNGEVQNGFMAPGRTVGKEYFNLIDTKELTEIAAKRALTLLEARPAPSGQFPVILAQGAGGVLFHEACGHGLEADHILRDPSSFAGKVGQKVANEQVTLIDDGTFLSNEGVGDWGTEGIDDEGYSSQRHVLIENGVLTDYMWDSLRANEQNGGDDFGGYLNSLEAGLRVGNGRRQSYKHLPMVRMTNTFVDRGELEPEDIIADTKYGIYIVDLSGGQVNTITGDFVFGMSEAYLIEDGKITAPLKPAQLIGNGPEVLQLVDAVGNDFATWSGTCGKNGQSVPVSSGQPTLRVAKMTVGGTG